MKLLLENWNKYLVNEVLTVFHYDEPMTATQEANYVFLKKQAKKICKPQKVVSFLKSPNFIRTKDRHRITYVLVS